jgi:hypothetical protein
MASTAVSRSEVAGAGAIAAASHGHRGWFIERLQGVAEMMLAMWLLQLSSTSR